MFLVTYFILQLVVHVVLFAHVRTVIACAGSKEERERKRKTEREAERDPEREFENARACRAGRWCPLQGPCEDVATHCQLTFKQHINACVCACAKRFARACGCIYAHAFIRSSCKFAVS